MDRKFDPKRKLVVPPLAWNGASDFRLMRELGFIPGIGGAEEGYNQSGDIVTQTADGKPLTQLWAEYQAALALYNADRDALMSVLTFGVTQNTENVFQAGNTVNFEEASEFGVPRGIRSAPPSYFALGYSFKWYDLAARFTWQYLAENPTSQIDQIQNLAMEADNRLMFMQVMKQVLNNVTRVAKIDEQNYNVFPIYNGDSTVPPRWKNTIHTAPHTHFLASGGATVVSGDLDDMYDHLRHHGYGWDEGTALVLLVNSAQMNVIRTFTMAGGDSYDFVPAQGLPSWALNSDALTALMNAVNAAVQSPAPPSSFQGLTVQGRYGPWLVVEEDLVPAGYMIGLASGGDNDARNLVGLREHANTSLRGLRLVKGQTPDYPLIDSVYQRGFGTGVRQRGAGVVMQVTAGSYTIPTGYTW
jgi:hypothetical protein